MATPKSEALEAARMEPDKSLRTGQGSALNGILVNGGLGAAKLAAGIFGHSYALIADACESFADVMSSSVTFYALKKASEPADPEHPAGHGRAETLASAVTALLLVAVGALIFYQSALSLYQPRKSPNPLTLFVLVPVILVKEFLFNWMRARGKKIGSLAVVADAWHQRSDAVTSVAALTGIIVAWVGGPSWSHADSWAAVAASIWLAGTGLWLLGPTMHELMEGSVDPSLLKYISDTSNNCPGIKGVDKVWVRKLGMRLMVDLHIEVDPDISVQEGHRLSHEVKDKLQRELPQVRDVMVHVEPYDPDRTKRPYRLHAAGARVAVRGEKQRPKRRRWRKG
jgi:cation diffusion facilitator family transporter